MKIKAFTLIELLVVISIISLLTSTVFASVTEARAEARDKKRLVESKSLATAVVLYTLTKNYAPTPNPENFVIPNSNDASGLYTELDTASGDGFEDVLDRLTATGADSVQALGGRVHGGEKGPFKYLCIDSDKNAKCDDGYFIPTVEKSDNAQACRVEGIPAGLQRFFCNGIAQQSYFCEPPTVGPLTNSKSFFIFLAAVHDDTVTPNTSYGYDFEFADFNLKQYTTNDKLCVSGANTTSVIEESFSQYYKYPDIIEPDANPRVNCAAEMNTVQQAEIDFMLMLGENKIDVTEDEDNDGGRYDGAFFSDSCVY